MIKRSCELLDLTDAAFEFLERNAGAPICEQIDAWAENLRCVAADLLAMCISSYESDGFDWREVVRQYVWPHLLSDLARMKTARNSARQVHGDVYELAVRALGLEFPVLFVFYVGIGSGAGWATRFRERPAVLSDLGNVAKLEWHEPSEMRKLLAHEIGHLYMFELRPEGSKGFDDPLSQLVEEGFAQHAEHLILGGETWGCCSQQGWLEWCRENEVYLARRYLSEIDDKEKIRNFFASFFDVDGWRQTGYFLGCRLVERLAKERAVEKLALLSLDEMRTAAREYLESFQ